MMLLATRNVEYAHLSHLFNSKKKVLNWGNVCLPNTDLNALMHTNCKLLLKLLKYVPSFLS